VVPWRKNKKQQLLVYKIKKKKKKQSVMSADVKVEVSSINKDMSVPSASVVQPQQLVLNLPADFPLEAFLRNARQKEVPKEDPKQHQQPQPVVKKKEAPKDAGIPDAKTSMVEELKRAWQNPLSMQFSDFMNIVVQIMKEAEKMANLTGPQKKQFVKDVIASFAQFYSSLPGAKEGGTPGLFALMIDVAFNDAFIDVVIQIANGDVQVVREVAKSCCFC
jgi:hypothetical protein